MSEANPLSSGEPVIPLRRFREGYKEANPMPLDFPRVEIHFRTRASVDTDVDVEAVRQAVEDALRRTLALRRRNMMVG